MDTDPSAGWNDVADEFVAVRSRIGADTVRDWSRSLGRGASILDIGCGSGFPVTVTLVEEGFSVSAVDASPKLLAAFRNRFPYIEAVCEPAETSSFFGRTFDGAVAIGLIFLLPAASQSRLIENVAVALKPGAKFLFSAPREACAWADLLTGRNSVSLGLEAYTDILESAGFLLGGTSLDEGGNHYFNAVRSA
jgi:SAM-dependent methyltransferase